LYLDSLPDFDRPVAGDEESAETEAFESVAGPDAIGSAEPGADEVGA
jgi:hypothetical protein